MIKRTNTAKPARRKTTVIPHKTEQPADWVLDMHTHYMQTGVYRAADLNRVLGDPREQVSGESSDELEMTCHPATK